jgi:superfamily II DNA helicase RecQ
MTWGDSFRPAYRSLHVLRNRIQRNIPWFGASATLRPDILKVCLEQGGFQKDTHIIYESLNRDNIYCDLRQMQFSARSVKDLLFLFPPSPTEHRDTRRIIQSIPKTIIFFRSTDQLLNARFQLVKTLSSRYSIPAKTAKRIVQAFYSHRSEFSKREIHGWFLDDNSEVRILVATDAVGMGMDFPNVEVCIQFDVPDNIDILLQRLGRAGRNPKLKAYFVWFIPSKLLKESSGDTQSTTTSQPLLVTLPVRKKTSSSKPSQSKKELPPELRDIIKTEGQQCFRQALWAPFSAGGHEYKPQPDRCCYFCHDHDRQHVYTHANEPTSAKDGERRQWKEQPHAFPAPMAQTSMTIMLRKALVEWPLLLVRIFFVGSLVLATTAMNSSYQSQLFARSVLSETISRQSPCFSPWFPNGHGVICLDKMLLR